jgi:hypothetical protein
MKSLIQGRESNDSLRSMASTRSICVVTLEPVRVYDDLLPHAETITIGGCRILVIGLDDLIRIKRHINSAQGPRIAPAVRSHQAPAPAGRAALSLHLVATRAVPQIDPAEQGVSDEHHSTAAMRAGVGYQVS